MRLARLLPAITAESKATLKQPDTARRDYAERREWGWGVGGGGRLTEGKEKEREGRRRGGGRLGET